MARSSLRSQLYRAARDLGNVQAGAKGPGHYPERVVRRKVYRHINGLTMVVALGFLSGALAAAVWDFPWWAVLVVGGLTATVVVQCWCIRWVALNRREIREARARREQEIRRTRRTTRWKRASLPKMARRRHQDKDIEKVMAEAEGHGWAFELTNKYWKGKCSCHQHIKWIKLTPPGVNYEKNLSGWFKRQSCW